MSAPLPQSERLAQVMEQSVAVVMFRMQGLPGHRKVPNAEVRVDNKPIEEGVFSAPTMRLMPPDWTKKFAKIHGKAERLITAASPPTSEEYEMPLPTGCHLIAGVRRDEIRQAIDLIATEELAPLRDSFCDEFPKLIAEMRKALGSEATWREIAPTIPSVAKLKERIMLRFVVLPFTFLSEAGRAIAEEVAQAVVAGITETLEDETAKLREKMGKGQVLKEGSLTEIRKQFQILKDFSFLAGEDTLTAMRKAEMEMDDKRLIERLNQDIKTGAGTIAANLNGALAGLTASARKNSLGGFLRRIKTV